MVSLVDIHLLGKEVVIISLDRRSTELNRRLRHLDNWEHQLGQHRHSREYYLLLL